MMKGYLTMNNKSGAKINMEKSILEAVYQMASESIDPENFENLEKVIKRLCQNRNLGTFDFFPRKERNRRA